MRFITLWMGLAISAAMFTPVAAQSESTRPDGSTLAEVVEAIEKLDGLRSGLAGTFDSQAGTADKSTFKKVCKPVGMQAKKLVKENGWQVIQMAEKYRNPKHQLDADGRTAYNLLSADPTLMGIWRQAEVAGQTGMRYFRRIEVESTCLMCHGPKAHRPVFVKQGYPEDRAYDFKAGDLRGIYSVFVPGKP